MIKLSWQGHKESLFCGTPAKKCKICGLRLPKYNSAAATSPREASCYLIKKHLFRKKLSKRKRYLVLQDQSFDKFYFIGIPSS